MEREILFSGKRVGNGEWVYGNLNILKDGVFILEHCSYGNIRVPEFHSGGMGCGLEDRNIQDRYESMRHGWERAIEKQSELLPNFIEIIPETVGKRIPPVRFVNRDIYAGDIIRLTNKEQYNNEAHTHMQGTGVVVMAGYEYFAVNGIRRLSLDWGGTSNIQHLGNIHDNPELLNTPTP